jgi:hypothetical protein
MFNPADQSTLRLDQRKGLQDYYFGSNIFFRKNGSVLVATYNILQEFTLSDYKKREHVPLVFTSFKVQGEELHLDTNINYISTITLPYDQNFLSFEVAALTFHNSELNSYAYMLEGYDEDWNYTGARRYGSYTGVKPGKYTLRIKASNDDNVWNEKGLFLNIVITPPFWQQWWFYALVCLAVAGIAYAIYRNRVNIIREREKTKTEFNKKVAEIEMTALRAQMNPHFLFNCLNSINRYVLMSDQMTASEYLTRFAKLIRLILDNSKQDYVSLEDELEALDLYMQMESLRFEQCFIYNITVSDDINTRSLQVPPLLLQPFVENAIWHGLMNKEGQGHISITVEELEELLHITIEDDGVGREKAREYRASQAVKRKSHGLQITTDRINILNKLNHSNARVQIIDLYDEERTPCGTKVIILLPIMRYHATKRSQPATV